MSQTMNPYPYVVNNPVNLTDPSGEIAPLLIAAGAYAIGFAVYASLPTSARNNPATKMAGYFFGYENILQDWETATDPCASTLQKMLAGGDMALNVILGILMFSGIGASLKTAYVAKLLGKMNTLNRLTTLRKFLPVGATLRILSKEAMEAAFGSQLFRPLGQKAIYMSREILQGNPWRLWGGFSHEVAHIIQEFGSFSKFAKPWQKLSAWAGKMNKTQDLLKLPSFLGPGYLRNPIEVHAFASGLTSTTNLLGLGLSRFSSYCTTRGINESHICLWNDF